MDALTVDYYLRPRAKLASVSIRFFSAFISSSYDFTYSAPDVLLKDTVISGNDNQGAFSNTIEGRQKNESLEDDVLHKRYCELTKDERRVYNRIKKRQSLSKIISTPEGYANLRSYTLQKQREFYDRLRNSGLLAEYHKKRMRRHRARKRAAQSARIRPLSNSRA